MKNGIKINSLVFVCGLLIISFCFPPSVFASDDRFPPKQNWFYGGGIGLGLGDVDYFEISPLVGYNINPRTSVGLSLLYRYRKDNRIEPSQSTNDYGSTLFGRFFVIPRVYIQAEYEYLSYEDYFKSSTERTNFGSFLAGGGATMPVGGNASLYLTALYNFSYDKADSPYSDPLVLRFGVGIGF